MKKNIFIDQFEEKIHALNSVYFTVHIIVCTESHQKCLRMSLFESKYSIADKSSMFPKYGSMRSCILFVISVIFHPIFLETTNFCVWFFGSSVFFLVYNWWSLIDFQNFCLFVEKSIGMSFQLYCTHFDWISLLCYSNEFNLNWNRSKFEINLEQIQCFVHFISGKMLILVQVNSTTQMRLPIDRRQLPFGNKKFMGRH